MEQRLNVQLIGQNALKTLYGIINYLKHSALEDALLQLVFFRVSQINGCAYCLDMHSKEARSRGETEQRLYGLNAWRETPYYTERERAALAWAKLLPIVKYPMKYIK
jgi:AhpD family alkylhydroperoxidase